MGNESEEFSPVNRPLAKAGEYYTRLAPWYDFLSSSEKKTIKAGLDLLAPQPDENLLEIGFGTGYAQKRIIPTLRDGCSVAVDISPGMAHFTKRKLVKASIANRSNLVCSDSLPLPFQSHIFDTIFSSFTLELFDTPQIPMLLGECRRVLKPTGRLVIASLSKDKPLTVMSRLYEAFHDRFPTIADCRPIPVRHLLGKNGFEVVESEDCRIWGLTVSLVMATMISDNKSS